MERSATSAGISGAAERIAASLRDFSLEATLPKQSELDALMGAVPPGTRVYLSCPPAHAPEQLVGYARAVQAIGLEPVPHLTARAYADTADLEGVVARLRREADVTTVLVIAGDRDEPAGRFASALDVIESDLLQAQGIREIGISGYPDGHPKIDDATLARVLSQKLEAARKRNLKVHVATQFCFDADRILSWIRSVRAAGIDVPIRVGLAGPTSMRALLRFALRCGVGASLRGMRNPKVTQLLGEAAPDDIIRTLGEAAADSDLGAVAVHFFSFGGLESTAKWAMAAASGQIELKPQGFRVVR